MYVGIIWINLRWLYHETLPVIATRLLHGWGRIRTFACLVLIKSHHYRYWSIKVHSSACWVVLISRQEQRQLDSLSSCADEDACVLWHISFAWSLVLAITLSGKALCCRTAISGVPTKRLPPDLSASLSLSRESDCVFYQCSSRGRCHTSWSDSANARRMNGHAQKRSASSPC